MYKMIVKTKSLIILTKNFNNGIHIGESAVANK